MNVGAAATVAWQGLTTVHSYGRVPAKWRMSASALVVQGEAQSVAGSQHSWGRSSSPREIIGATFSQLPS